MVRVGLLRLLVMWESEAGEIPVIEQNWILFRFFTLMISKMRSVSVMGFLMWIFSSQGMVSQEGLLLGRGTLCSLAAVLFVLPGFLMLFDRFVIKDGTERPEMPDIQDIPDMLRKLSLKDSKEKGQ